MNGILSRSSHESKSNHTNTQNRPQSVETAGSLAMWQQSLLQQGDYDMFMASNPFAVDYSMYSFGFDDVSSAFLSNFSNAVAVIGDGGFSAGGGGFSSASSGFSGGGGFSSFC